MMNRMMMAVVLMTMTGCVGRVVVEEEEGHSTEETPVAPVADVTLPAPAQEATSCMNLAGEPLTVGTPCQTANDEMGQCNKDGNCAPVPVVSCMDLAGEPLPLGTACECVTQKTGNMAIGQCNNGGQCFCLIL